MLHIRDFVDQNGHRHHTGTVRPVARDLTGAAESIDLEVRPNYGPAIRAAIVVIAGVAVTVAIFTQSPMIPLEATMFLGP